MKRNPKVIELDYDELRSKLDQIEAVMGPQMVEPFRQLLQWYVVLLGLLREKSISIRRLRKMLFGASTERTSNVLPSSTSSEDEASDAATDESETDQPAGSTPDSAPSSGDPPRKDRGERPRRPGHGRNPADAYTGCAKILVTHPWLHPGDPCPDCVQGTVYRLKDWSPVVRLKGQPPVGGTVYKMERLRCHLCGGLHIAEPPEEAGPEKYDPSVASIIGTLRYGEGVPWNRIARIQQSGGVPLPASTQWEVVRDAVERGLRSAYDYLLHLGAQGELVHNDDTKMRVLELMDRLKKNQPLLEEAPDRRGMFTTGILSLAKGRPTIALFFTGPYHSGENLRNVLAKRQQELPPPIQMCDPLSLNMPEDLRVIVANCLAHGRRKFTDVAEAFPSEVKYVLECLKQVYKTESQAKKQELSADQRLRLHQESSRPVLDELHEWMTQQLDEKKVEPNSSLGGAINYMRNHWEKLTLFLRVPGAPLDNNICEQALKMSIRHRKNSLFYKTLRGAAVGDLCMSLIHTCYFSGADPFDYLTQLQRNQESVRAAPADWMPWNYRQQLASAQSAWRSNGSTAEHSGGVRAPPPDSG